MVMADSARSRARVLRLSRRLIYLATFLVGACPANETPAQSAADLAEASLETLMNLEVSSPGRKEQKLSQTASAVYVITQDDIRRSGMTSIPELLRMVPGVQVARIDASSWSVTARGFAGRFADKMLVLIDGRSIYNHSYSGVYWEQNGVPLGDIERIEVIRGPGATMWGANAVNGVINIITKPARESQGLEVTTGGGSDERAFGSVRYGGSAGDGVFYRADAEYYQDGPLSTATGQPAHDKWDSAQGGGRLDWQISRKDALSVEGNVYRGNAQETVYSDYPAISIGQPVLDSVALSGEYALARWIHRSSDRSDLAMQVSLSDEDRLEGFGGLDVGTAEFDFQHHLILSPRHNLIWGLGFQLYRDDTTSHQPSTAPASWVRYIPVASTQALASFFAQDEVALMPERLTLTLGTKIEYAGYFGADIQPSARLMWNVGPRQGLWASASRAVRTPALADRDLFLEYQPTPNPGVIGVLSGNPNFRPETALAYEAGYRNQPARWVTVDLAAFFCNYRDLRTIDVGAPFLEAGPPAALVAPMQFGNGADGHTYGLEMASNWRLTQKWRVSANFSWFRYGLDRAELPAESIPLDVEGSSPAQQVQIRSQWDLGPKVAIDVGVYYVSPLTGIGVPGYVRTDTRLGWRVARAAEISLAGQNLLDGRHLEFATTDYVRCTQVGRSILLKVTWAF